VPATAGIGEPSGLNIPYVPQGGPPFHASELGHSDKGPTASEHPAMFGPIAWGSQTARLVVT